MVKQRHCYGSVCVMPSSEQKLPYGTEREALLREESQLETASNVSEWVCRLDCRRRSRAAVFGWRPLVCARTDSELGVSPADRANALYGPSIRYRRWDNLDDEERLIADIAQGCFQRRSRPEIFRRNQKTRRFKPAGFNFRGVPGRPLRRLCNTSPNSPVSPRKADDRDFLNG